MLTGKVKASNMPRINRQAASPPKLWVAAIHATIRPHTATLIESTLPLWYRCIMSSAGNSESRLPKKTSELDHEYCWPTRWRSVRNPNTAAELIATLSVAPRLEWQGQHRYTGKIIRANGTYTRAPVSSGTTIQSAFLRTAFSSSGVHGTRRSAASGSCAILAKYWPATSSCVSVWAASRTSTLG
jgi:hypothetical protein